MLSRGRWGRLSAVSGWNCYFSLSSQLRNPAIWRAGDVQWIAAEVYIVPSVGLRQCQPIVYRSEAARAIKTPAAIYTSGALLFCFSPLCARRRHLVCVCLDFANLLFSARRIMHHTRCHSTNEHAEARDEIAPPGTKVIDSISLTCINHSNPVERRRSIILLLLFMW
jgi:hypothetical protein